MDLEFQDKPDGNSNAPRNRIGYDPEDSAIRCSHPSVRILHRTSLYISRLTARVSGGWGGKGLETENCHSSEKAQKRAESQPSGARYVRRAFEATLDLTIHATSGWPLSGWRCH